MEGPNSVLLIGPFSVLLSNMSRPVFGTTGYPCVLVLQLEGGGARPKSRSITSRYMVDAENLRFFFYDPRLLQLLNSETYCFPIGTAS